MNTDEMAEVVMKVLAERDKLQKTQDVSTGPIETMKSNPETLQMSPEGEARKEGTIPDVNEVVPIPEDAEGLCVQAKVAKGVPEGTARAECAQGVDKVSETLPDEVSLAKESKDQEEGEEKPMSCVEKAMEGGKSKEEAESQCAPKEGDSKLAALDAFEKQIAELQAYQTSQAQKAERDAERDAKVREFLVDSIIDKGKGAYKPSELKDESICYLKALDGILDGIQKGGALHQKGRLDAYPSIEDSEKQEVGFQKPYVGKRTKDGYEVIK